MKAVMKINIYLLKILSLLFIFPALTIAQENLSDSQIKEIIKNAVENNRSSGIVVGILDEHGSRVIGYGETSKENGKTPDRYTMYEIGSVTKVFTSLLLEDMSEHGELSINDPISKFLPKNVKTPTKDGKEIKLIDLSNQTSGLPRMPDNFILKDRSEPFAGYTAENLYSYLSNYKLTRGIGETYEYSNTGVGLLGHILTLKTGKNYETLLRTRICNPLKMDNTVITLTPEEMKYLATGYNKRGRPAKIFDFSIFEGAGAIKSNVNDMLIFAEANLGLLKSDLYPEMLKTHEIKHAANKRDLYIGMGWHVWKKYNREIVWHRGGTGGYTAFIGLDEQNKKAVVVLSNSSIGVSDIGLHLLESKFTMRM
jgi:CubicO group peptidase (beta-lactamase class C family)